MPFLQSFSDASEDPLPPGGLVLVRQEWRSTWHTKNGHRIAIELLAETMPDKRRMYNTGEIMLDDDRWKITFSDETRLSVVLKVFNAAEREVVCAAITPIRSKCSVLLLDTPCAFAPAGTRDGLFDADRKPLALWWPAWKDIHREQNIEEFAWVNVSRLGDDWPVAVVLHSLVRAVSGFLVIR